MRIFEIKFIGPDHRGALTSRLVVFRRSDYPCRIIIIIAITIRARRNYLEHLSTRIKVYGIRVYTDGCRRMSCCFQLVSTGRRDIIDSQKSRQVHEPRSKYGCACGRQVVGNSGERLSSHLRSQGRAFRV